MTQKILIIAFTMIPNAKSWGSSQRIYYLAESLVNAGMGVTVLHSANKNYGFFNKTVNFNRIAIPLKFNLLQKLLLGAPGAPVSSIKNRKNNFRNKIESLLKARLGFLDKFLFNDPNAGAGITGAIWIQGIKSFIRNFILNGGDSIVVIISGPPFSVFSISAFIKNNFPAVKVILDYRDPWNLWNNRKGISFFKEKSALINADRIIVTNESLKMSMASTFNISVDKFAVVLNGYSAESWKNVSLKLGRSSNNQIRIAYIGSINFESYRDPTHFLKAYDLFSHQKDVRLSFIGLQNVSELNYLKKKYPNEIILKGRVTPEESFAEMMDNDILIVFHTANDYSGKYLTSAKLYDYIRSGKVIWSIGNKCDLNSVLVEENKLGVTSENNVEDILATFETLYEAWEKDGLKKYANASIQTDFYSREFQNARYLEIIRKEIEGSLH